MHISKNCYQQNASGQDDHKFLISSHKHHPFLQNSERVGARPPAARLNMLLDVPGLVAAWGGFLLFIVIHSFP